MNKVYKIVWNASHQVWVAVSELARGKVKSSSKMLTAGVGIILLPAQFTLAAPGIRDLPSLNNIASGSATLTTTTGNLTVDQSTSKLVANWNSFNVGSAAKVTFNQPDANSIALNRISSAAPSEVFGRVIANGKLILVNPAGLTIGSTGQISAASVVASTLNISDADFNADTLIFERGTSTGEINNQGTILATAGSTALLAPTIRNSGTTRAISGNVTLANGNKLTVADTTVTLNQSSGIPGLIQSTGTIRADRLATTNGKVYLVGDRARTGSLIQLAGTLTSNGVDVKGKTVEVTGALETNSSTNMNAINSININGAMNVVGNNRLIGLVHGTGTGEGYFLGSAGKISMPGTGDKFRVNGQYFKLIQTLAQLQDIGANATTLADQTYVIANDIDASSTATTAFTPLGTTTTAFTGSINGLGNSINNLTINKPASDNVGLVGYATGGSISNLKLSNANIIGRNYVGGLIGQSYNDAAGDSTNPLGNASLWNNQVTGTVKGKTYTGGLVGYAVTENAGSASIKNSKTNADVSGDSQVGGVLGGAAVNSGSLSLSQLQVDGPTHGSAVTGTKSQIGGVVGFFAVNNDAAFNLSDAANNGAVSSTRVSSEFGGVIGGFDLNNTATASINNIANQGNVNVFSDSNNTGYYTGGVIGGIDNYSNDSSRITINNASNTANINAGTNGSYVGGVIGWASNIGLSNSTSQGSVNGNSNIGGLIGYIVDSMVVGNSSSVDVTGATTIGGLIGQAQNTVISNSHASGQVNAAQGWGAGGLVGYAHSGGSITASYATGNVTGGESIGGLIGSNNTGATISNSHAEGDITGVTYVGGLVGYNEGSIDHSYATGAVFGASNVGGLVGQSYNTTINNSSATGDVTSTGSAIGGLVGYNWATAISNSYAEGSVSAIGNNVGGLVGYHEGGSVDHSYATGVVSGTSSIGGLIGSFYAYNNANIQNSYATGNVTADNHGGGLIGYLQTQSDSTNNVTNNYASGNVNASSGGNGDSLGGLIGGIDAYGSSRTLNLSFNYASGTVTGNNEIGGFIGRLLSYSYSDSSTYKVNVLNNYATGSVTGNTGVGGFIGNSNAYIGNIYITSNYSSGLVTGTDTASTGGFIGSAYDNSGTSFITKNYWNKTSSGQTVAIGYKQLNRTATVTGLTAAQMNQQASFVGWDISNLATGSSSIWYINEGVSAPVLRSLMTP